MMKLEFLSRQEYGKEIKERYSEETVEKSNAQFKNMTEEQYDELHDLSNEVLETLKKAYATQDPASELGQKAAELHAKWISFCWGSYDKEAHANLTQKYVDDERFRKYYDKDIPGTAEFLRDAVIYKM